MGFVATLGFCKVLFRAFEVRAFPISMILSLNPNEARFFSAMVYNITTWTKRRLGLSICARKYLEFHYREDNWRFAILKYPVWCLSW